MAKFIGQCQSPADWWYFGQNAGIHFLPSGPVGVNDGEMTTGEGCASISSASGDLLFYTDGTSTWNSDHLPMLNGSGLLGNSSASQSAIIVPAPNSSHLFYIITTPEWIVPDSGLRYSIVDMNLDGGLGAIVVSQKNLLITNNIAENVCVVQHAAPNKFWLIAHKSDADSLYAFEISSSGIDLTPVVSHVPELISAKVGCIKGSISGSLIGYASYFTNENKVKIMQFNNASGQVVDVISFTPQIVSQSYGFEFSPDETKAYVASFGSGVTVQFDISIYDSTLIVGSETQIYAGSTGQLQLGPDGIIYQALNGSQYLNGILNPNELGILCDYQDSVVLIGPQASSLGLPPFIGSFFNVNFSFQETCSGDFTFFYLDTANVDSVVWNFGDPTTGVQNTSTGFFPGHVFSDTGSFTVTLIAYSDTISDTTLKTIFIFPRQTLDLGPDTLLCEGETLELNIHQDYSTYLWHDGSTADSILLTSDIQAFVTLFGVCDTLQDTINARFDKIVHIDLGPDTNFCEGSAIKLDADVTVEADYQWNTGDTADHITVAQSGLYIFQAENGCGEFNDSISVTIIPLPDTALLPADTINCFDNQIILERPVNDSITYIWSDSTSGPRFEVDSTQQVWLAAFNECGFSADTMNFLFNGEIKTELGEDTNICDKDSIMLSGIDSTARYQWSTGDTTISIYTEVGLDENYIVTIFKGECAKVESKRVRSSDVFCPSIDCDLEYGNVFSPNGDGMNDLFRITSDCDVYSFDMTIYNRWGQLVHYSQNVAFGWDGYVNGEPAAEGVYYFVVEYKDFVVVDADRQLTRGSFTLVR